MSTEPAAEPAKPTRGKAPTQAAPILNIPPPSSLTALGDAQVVLAELLKHLFPEDVALHRAIDRLRRLRYVHPPLEFTGVEAVFQSSSQGEDEQHRVGLDDDGQEPTVACTCPGRGWPWCIHRLRFRLELAELALRDPLDLIERILDEAARLAIPEPTPARPITRMPEGDLPDTLLHLPANAPTGTPPQLPGGEPPPPDEHDRREDGAPEPSVASRPARAGKLTRREVAELLASIEQDYPL